MHGEAVLASLRPMPITLRSYLSGRWQAGSGKAIPLFNPAAEEVAAEASTEKLDLQAGATFAREKGRPAVRALAVAPRGERLQAPATRITDSAASPIGVGRGND